MQLTAHARLRQAQRGIPMEVIECILAYGKPRPSRGATSLMLDRSSIDLAADGNRALRATLERYRRVFVIISDADLVITCARTYH